MGQQKVCNQDDKVTHSFRWNNEDKNITGFQKTICDRKVCVAGSTICLIYVFKSHSYLIIYEKLLWVKVSAYS